jgi:hypothetical protein
MCANVQDTTMDISLRHTLRIRPDVVFRQLDDEAVLLDLKSGTYFGLNTVGTRVWQLLGDHVALSTVLETLAGEYDVDRDELERDLLSLSRELCDRGLTEIT